MKRDLFVFAGQSNMVGACAYPPKKKVSLRNSFEYKHTPKRLGAKSGSFVSTVYPVGEFSYIDLKSAYAPDMVDENGLSKLNNYRENAYFSSSMSNLKSEAERSVHPFAIYSESTAPLGATLAPFLVEEWERLGGACAYAHIAKGGVPIGYYFTDEMVKEYEVVIEVYNEKHGTSYSPDIHERIEGAADYFLEKCRDFFEDAKSAYPEDELSNKCLFWLQGEADAKYASVEYQLRLEVLWKEAKKIGFTHFFIIRVDYFGSPLIHRVMRAQENFTDSNSDVYILTRAASYLTFPGQEEDGWFKIAPGEEYRNCRDSYFGLSNDHINEKGFILIAKRSAQNLYRVLVEGKEPILEEENILPLIIGE